MALDLSKFTTRAPLEALTMGMFDSVYIGANPTGRNDGRGATALVCGNGHDLTGLEFQTKDLSQSCTDWQLVDGAMCLLPGGATRHDAYGGAQPPYSLTMAMYCSCPKCPRGPGGGSFHSSQWVEFDVVLDAMRVTDIRRTVPPADPYAHNGLAAE